MMADFFDVLRGQAHRSDGRRGRSSGRGADALRSRRAARTMRRVSAVLCAGLAVVAALGCVLASVETRPVLVAVTPAVRGESLADAQLALVQVPAADCLDGAVGSWDEWRILFGEAAIAAIDIAAGQPIFPTMIRASPVVPAGHTVIGIRLASDGGTLLPGDEIELVSAVGCTDDERSCRISGHAVVMGTDGEYTAVALSADDALRVMASQEAGAIVAVTR
ncbi:SAF domain-containing protein [Bifidobacterium samirii]|uniref:Cation transport ATPase n=1 Tax=Bifidobacterium samirii TaxID=2306974 RepID=A0A430FDQ9_9BIFI|nr:SAF domain-containing protein [Bifidobacterium samirii]RSX51024.1 Cation transport ATPase [Bifidobacterium samirii]